MQLQIKTIGDTPQGAGVDLCVGRIDVSGCGGASAGVATPGPAPRSGKIVLDLDLAEGRSNTVSDLATPMTEYTITNAQATGRYGDPMGPAWKSGKAIGPSCLRFDGYSTLIRMGALAPKALEGGVTASAWVAPYAFEWGDAPDSPRLSALLSQADLERAIGFVFGLYRYGTWGVSLGNGLQMPTLLVARDEDRVRRNAWSHIAFTYDPRTQRVRFFRNGAEVLTGQVSIGKLVMPKIDLQIGRHSEALGIVDVFKFNSFAGLANHIRMHDYALDDRQIKAMVEADLLTIGGQVPELDFDDVDIGPAYLATDRHRPAFHAQPNFGWMNEPHAPIYYNGKYHLFYQKNPFGPFWHQIHWGHWVSDDMVHWSEVDIENRGISVPR